MLKIELSHWDTSSTTIVPSPFILYWTFKSSLQASCIDSTAQPEAVFASEVKKLQADKLKPQEQLTLEPYERDHAVVVGIFRPPAKKA